MLSANFNLPLTITYDKNGSTLLQVFGFHDHDGIMTVFDLIKVTLWTLNIEQFKWSHQDLNPEQFMGYGNDIHMHVHSLKKAIILIPIDFNLGSLISLRGLLYYFSMPNEDFTLGYFSYNSTSWKLLPNKAVPSCRDKVLVFILTFTNFFSMKIFVFSL